MGRSVPETVCIDGIESIGPGGSLEERVYEIELITPMYGGVVVFFELSHPRMSIL